MNLFSINDSVTAIASSVDNYYDINNQAVDVFQYLNDSDHQVRTSRPLLTSSVYDPFVVLGVEAPADRGFLQECQFHL